MKQQPYHLLLLTAILLIIAGLFIPKSAMVIQWHDRYHIFSLLYFIWTTALFLFVFWLLYLVTKNILFSKALSWTHIIWTVVGCICILKAPFFLRNYYEGLAGMPRRYIEVEHYRTYQSSEFSTRTLLFLVVILLIGQLTFLINFFVGVYIGRAGKSTL